jgi:K+-sensing histidine kinase KdpD
VFASQLALALDNARAHEQLGERVDELVRTRDQLIQAEKCALAGRLAGCVAHEINTPLTYVRANLEALLDYSTTVGGLWLAAKEAACFLLRQDDGGMVALGRNVLEVGGSGTEAVIQEVAAVVEETLEGVRRIADLVSGFSHLGEPGVPAESERGSLDLGVLLAEVLTAVAAGRTVEADLAPGCVIPASAADVRASIGNLVGFLCPGWRSHSPDAGPIRVTLHREHGRPALTLSDPSLRPTDEELAALFEPRIATRSDDKRTLRVDLALALAAALLRRNGAQVCARRSVEGGLALRVEFSQGGES